jgi:alpha-tubulin suppressor-like RCC1 family protein
VGDVAAVTAGEHHTCALDESGHVWCWGSNEYGQLGDGTTEDRTKPSGVVGLDDRVVAISAGGVHTCALTDNGSVKCWGSNWLGQLGTETTETCFAYFRSEACSTVPVDAIDNTGKPLTGAVALSAGSGHTCVLTPGASVRCWGDNTLGQLGDNGNCGSRCGSPVEVCADASCVHALSGVTTMGAFFDQTCAVTKGGVLRCWGDNSAGQSGGKRCGTSCPTPIDIAALSNVVAISGGARHTCALTADGGTKCWGDNGKGQLGDGRACIHFCFEPVDVAVVFPKPTPTATPLPSGPLGDVDCSGDANSVDAAIVLQFSARLVTSMACQHRADVNGDRIVNSLDAALILQHDAGLVTLQSR